MAMRTKDFDEFLNDATLAVRELWEKATGQTLDQDATYALNDLLTAFFRDKY